MKVKITKAPGGGFHLKMHGEVQHFTNRKTMFAAISRDMNQLPTTLRTALPAASWGALYRGGPCS